MNHGYHTKARHVVSPVTRGTPRIRETRRLATYADYAATPDEERWELLNGMLVREPSPGFPHQDVLARLHIHLGTWAQRTDPAQVKVLMAPYDVVLSEHTVVQPDILVLTKDKGAHITRRGLEAAPNLAAELLSPSSGKRDFETKRHIYEEAGVGEYWIVDPEHGYVWQFVREGDRLVGRKESPLIVGRTTGTTPGPKAPVSLQSVIFPSLSVDLDQIFHDPWRAPPHCSSTVARG